MRDLNDLSLFAAVVAAGGFSAAGRDLGMPKSRLSRHVAALEERLGLRLIERSTRRFAVTPFGMEVYRHAQAMVSAADAIEDMALNRKSEPEGLVRVSVPLMAERSLSAPLAVLLAEHPRLRVQLLVTNRRVDLIEEGVDVAVRVRDNLDSDGDLTMRAIGRASSMLAAAPALLADRPDIADPHDLAALPSLGHTERPGPDVWHLVGPGGARHNHSHNPRLATHDFVTLIEAARDGLGVGLLPERYCRPFLANGSLVRVLPDWSGSEGILHVVFTSRRGLLPGVRIVIDTIVEALRERFEAPCGDEKSKARLHIVR